MTNNDEFTPRVVDEIPPAKTGSRGKSAYDSVFDLAVEHAPNPVLAAESVLAHRAVILREALALRLERLENRQLAETGRFVVTSRGVGTDSRKGKIVNLVDLYVKFVPVVGAPDEG